MHRAARGHGRLAGYLQQRLAVRDALAHDMMNPTLRDTPTWTAALVIEGLTAFYRSILGQTYDALHVFFRCEKGLRMKPRKTGVGDSRCRNGNLQTKRRL
jgi:hypothetical protein